MTQITPQQSIRVQEAKNRLAMHHRITYHPQAANKRVQVAMRVVSLEPKSLLKRVVECAKHVKHFHYRSKPMPDTYSSQKSFYADKAAASQMQEAFLSSLC